MLMIAKVAEVEQINLPFLSAAASEGRASACLTQEFIKKKIYSPTHCMIKSVSV